ncbi:cytochrome c [Phenylobacterium zucineum]|nr:cytochrome c [Phenylobacterium zucineum]
MRTPTFAAVLAVLTGAALAGGGAALAQSTAMADLMKQTVNPAALAFWAAGNEPPPGERPAAAAARWRAALDAARVLEAEGRRMQRPAYTQPGEWDAYAQAMADAAAGAVPALRARDAEAAFAAGGALYDSCNGCHKIYAPALR